MPQEKVRIGDLLLQRDLISQEQLELAIAEQRSSGVKLGEAVVNLGFVAEHVLLNTLADQLELPFIDLSEYPCQPSIVQMLPETHARRFRALVLADNEHGLLVGMSDPQNIFAIDEISGLLGQTFNLALVEEAALLRTYDLFYDYTGDINRFAEELSGELTDETVANDILGTLGETEAPVAKLLQSLLDEADRLNASDIHIAPSKDSLLIRLRVDGVLQEQVVHEKEVVAALTQRLKLMANLDIADKRLPQDGRLQVKLNQKNLDIRLATMPVENGESVVMRLLRPANDRGTLDSLEMSPVVLQGVRKLMRRSHGMFLVTGPTGSGKTTTLYGVLQELNTPQVKIITVEDPVEYRLPRICQVQINNKIDLSFARVLRSVLRHDPDVIMVGELRDQESAEIAMRAAMTGHLVLATMHTNDVLSSAMRLIDMGVESYLVAIALRGVLAQRLLRRICPRCITDHSINDEERSWLSAVTGDIHLHAPFKVGKGCNNCNGTGYLGRKGVYDLLSLNHPMMDALRENDVAAFSRAVNENKKGHSLGSSALALALQGGTTLEEVMRIAEDLMDGETTIDTGIIT